MGKQKTKDLKYTKSDDRLNDLEKAYVNDAGIDLQANAPIRINGGGQGIVPTGIRVDIPKGYYGQIKERSGFSIRHSLGIKAGVIDAGYTGEIKVVMFNYGPYPEDIERGDGIAQLVLMPIGKFKPKKVEALDKESERGDKGFGSSDES